MAGLDLRSLIARCNDTCRKALEAAAGLTVARTHYNVEIEHLLLALLDRPGSDLSAIVRHFDIDAGRVAKQLTRAMDGLGSGNARAPAMSRDIVTVLKQAWLLASIDHGAPRIRSGHILLAFLSDPDLLRHLREASPLLGAIEQAPLQRDFAQAVAGSEETTATDAQAPAAPAPASAAPSSGTALGQFTTDLTARARAGKIDPILGRDTEIRQAIDILTRRRQNNPILTGEAGVGKTAVVEGLAQRIASGDVPQALAGVELRTLDLGLLQAGAGMKGEFENRLKSVIDEVKASPRPVILFIDEAHTLIGAGGQQGQNDAANLLKPALARGELRTIAATTWAEYKKYFEKDAALTRRFQVVKVDEPSEPMAAAMIRGLTATLEKHHGVRILDEAVTEAVRLSARFIPARQLPDKAVSLIDTACARVGMSQAAVPPQIEDKRRRIGLIDTELSILAREAASGADHVKRREALETEREAVSASLTGLEARWERENELVARWVELRTQAEAAGPDASGTARSSVAAAKAELEALQAGEPLVFGVVDGQAVAEVVQAWTGIPVGRMRSGEIRSVLNLTDQLGQRIIGQSHALEAIARSIQVNRAKLTDPRKPVGVFLMVGTSGTGKTETALALADLLYGGEQNLTVINMTEFKEEHKVSLLMGSPPGYVGYGEGGILTEAVRRRPYSVVLLDEMEKAHPGVQDVFYQVFDKGTMKDGEGRDIDFRNTVIIMTSNQGSDLVAQLFSDPLTAPDAEGLADALRPELLKCFKPAFLGRVTVVPYLPLAPEVLRGIIELQLGRIRTRIAEAYRASFDWDPALVGTIADRCTESGSGARNIDHILSRTLLPELSTRLLSSMAEGKDVSGVTVGLDRTGYFCYQIV